MLLICNTSMHAALTRYVDSLQVLSDVNHLLSQENSRDRSFSLKATRTMALNQAMMLFVVVACLTGTEL